MPPAIATKRARPRVTAMITATLPPTADRVRAACDAFDRDHHLTEQTLEELFRQYPNNSDPRHILLKVVAVNSLHHTCIFALDTVARHIQEHHKEIDRALAAGSPETVDVIAKVKVGGKVYNFFSFATKYCNWHNPSAYPVYDAHVDHYLWAQQQQSRFSSFLHPDLWNYPKFHKIMTDFRSFHKLGSFTFKEIDKFLCIEAAPPRIESGEPQPCGPGAFDFYPAEELAL
jgi:hypothetical protein